MSEPRIAVVIEDDRDARELTELVLTQSGFQVVTASDGEAGVAAVREHNPLLTTLDVQMPGMDGFATAKRLREFSLTYLIMVTSMAGEIDIISGFEAGADDYLVKPFRPRELRARADALLRRMRLGSPIANAGAAQATPLTTPAEESWAAAAARELRQDPLEPSVSLRVEATTAPPAAVPAPRPAAVPSPRPQPVPQSGPQSPPRVVATPIVAAPTLPEPAVLFGADLSGTPEVLRFGELSLDRETGRTTYGGRTVELSTQEFDVLRSLLSTGRRVRSKADLVLALRGNHTSTHFVNEADKRRLDTIVASVRAKLGDDEKAARVIETVRGVGYRLAS